MKAELIGEINAAFAHAQDRGKLFPPGKDAEKIKGLELREQPQFNVPSESCKTKLFLGIFFDGTKNNYEASDQPGKDGTFKLNHTNIARLYDCFPGMSVPGVLPQTTDWEHQLERYSHFFRVYVPGVGTPFSQINDSGGTLGAATSLGGEPRVVWALVQVINCLHRYFLKQPLIDNDQARRLARRVELDHVRLRQLQADNRSSRQAAEATKQATQAVFSSVLQQLHKALGPHLHDGSGRPSKIDPGIVTGIELSIFGFSRGATQARVFANWLVELCKLDARLRRSSAPLTLAGFPVELPFLGIFDTVASVGIANLFGNQWGMGALDGHAGFADAELSLRVPAEIEQCLHLIAGHEVRRSFPVDSVSVGKVLPGNCTEVVVPGVHSDIGGGYCPREQGRGSDPSGADMLSRVPLIYMYRHARLAGVPLKLELAKPETKQRFRLLPATIAAFNNYLAHCPTKTGDLTAIMREQRQMFIRWKVLRRVSGAHPLDRTRSFNDASEFDRNDLRSANHEFEHELAEFERWRKTKGDRFSPRAQPAGFGDSHEKEWEEIATWWQEQGSLPSAVVTLFDDLVHDSRAWFKAVPGHPDSEDDVKALLASWVKAVQMARRAGGRIDFLDYGLSAEQVSAADEFSRTGRIPAMLNGGREPFAGAKAGYLRYRKVYAGADSWLLSQRDSERLRGRGEGAVAA